MNKAHRKISPGSLYSMGGKKNRCMTPGVRRATKETNQQEELLGRQKTDSDPLKVTSLLHS